MRRRTTWVLGISLAFVALLAGSYVLRVRAAERKLEQARHNARQGLALLAGRVVERPAVLPWPDDRPAHERRLNARPIYSAAMAYLLGLPDSELEILPENRHEDLESIDEARVHAYLRKHAAFIADLGDVLHADRISTDASLLDGLERTTRDVPGWQALSSHLRGTVRNAFERGAFDEAVRPILLQLCAGHDCARTNSLIHLLVGMGIAGSAVADARSLLASQALDADALARFAAALDRIERNRGPMSAVWTTEELLIREVTARTHLADEEFGDVGAGWRHLWSEQLFACEALEAYGGPYARLRALDTLSVGDAQRAAQGEVDAMSDGAHPFARMAIAVAPLAYDRVAQFQAKWQLLRIAAALAHFRAEHGDWPATLGDLVPHYPAALEPCPYSGEPLGYAAGKVWSVGGDGDDDGGRPQSWDDEWDDEGDVVWDLNDKTRPDPFEDLK